MADGPIKVLMAESNPADAQSLRQALAKTEGAERFRITQVERLSETLERLAKEPFDVVLLDLILPDSRGLDTLLKVQDQKPSVPVVAIHALNDEMLAVEAIREGAQDYLVKGQIDGNFLVRSLLFAIERKHLEKGLARLATFPELSPNPIIESDLKGVVTYLNPAARKHFADLPNVGPQHPVLEGLKSLIETLQKDEKKTLVREIQVGTHIYEQHISFISELKLIRFHINDITERKQAEENLRTRNEESERLNKVMIGRELKMIELKEEITRLKDQLEGKKQGEHV